MARTVNQEEYTARRGEILDAAQRLVLTKGYERLTIQDVLGVVGISKGAFYHYFDSKPALLEALVERMQQEAESHLLPIIGDPSLSAVEKLRRFFATLDSLRSDHQAFLTDLARVWYADDNAIVREKVDATTVKRRAPLLNAIVRQGIEEGVFTTAYLDQIGEIMLSLTRGMSNTLARLMLSFEDDDPQRVIGEIVATHAAYADAIERILGAPPGSFYRIDADNVATWLAG